MSEYKETTGPEQGSAAPVEEKPQTMGPNGHDKNAADPNIRISANLFLAWQRDHIAASEHNHTISTVYALLSHYKDVVPVMPKLVYYATMNTSGKSTAARAVMYVGNFGIEARRISKLSAAAIIRLADDTKSGVPIEDAHRFRPNDSIFDFLVNSFPVDGILGLADLKNQKKVIRYYIGGTPIVVTTNAISKLDQDTLRRCIKLPMLRQAPRKRMTRNVEKYKKELEPFHDVFSSSTIHNTELVKAHVDDPLPDWMTEDVRDRWISLFAVTRALLGDGWLKRLEEAARWIEDVTYTPNEVELLLTDLWEIYQADMVATKDKTIGAIPVSLYEELRDRNPDQWKELSDTKLGIKVREIRDGDGRKLERLNVPAGAEVFTKGWTVKRGAKYFPWAHFEAAWKSYGIGQARPVSGVLG